CRATITVAVGPLPAAITGTAGLCAGYTTSLSDGTAGGTWSSGHTAVGTVSTSGVVSGVSAGTAVVTYKLGTGCMSTDTVTVNAAPSAITGATGLCSGASATL